MSNNLKVTADLINDKVKFSEISRDKQRALASLVWIFVATKAMICKEKK
ncbi:hypothetical protein LGK97_16650 [Clostridium sp. CS001]|nr:hypothetical protein [Clostridium sp. CS001]MCB2291358.1 hypothetical protein [Clostridium sp. CS001]